MPIRKTLLTQRKVLALLAQEKEDISWQGLIFKVPRGLMAWAVKAGTNTLGIAVEIKGSDAHANSEDTFNLKKSTGTAKAKIPEAEEDKQFKPDYFE